MFMTREENYGKSCFFYLPIGAYNNMHELNYKPSLLIWHKFNMLLTSMYIINLIVFDKNNVYAYGIPNQEIRYPKAKDAYEKY